MRQVRPGEWGHSRHTEEILLCFCTSRNSTVSRTQVSPSKWESNSPSSAAAQRPPGRVPGAVRSGGLTSLAFFSLTHLSRSSTAWGAVLLGGPPGASFSCPRLQVPFHSKKTSKASPSPPSRRLQKTKTNKQNKKTARCQLSIPWSQGAAWHPHATEGGTAPPPAAGTLIPLPCQPRSRLGCPSECTSAVWWEGSGWQGGFLCLPSGKQVRRPLILPRWR